jgi:uncharacterized protein (TIGR03435 family)
MRYHARLAETKDAMLPATFPTHLWVAAATLATFVAAAQAQTSSPEDGPAFEVASVKPNTSVGGGGGYGTRAGGIFYATRMTPLALVRLAYGVEDFQIEQAPSWLTSERFDIDARAGVEWQVSSPTSAPATLAPMLRNLLRDRFAFEAQWEKRRGTVVTLVREEASPPRLTSSTANCVTVDNQPPGKDQKCGFMMRPGLISAASVSISELATMLSQQLGTRVVDGTSLPGRFDVRLEFRPENLPPATATLSDTPSLPVALREQLGLTLRRQEADIDVLVVTRVQRPTAN